MPIKLFLLINIICPFPSVIFTAACFNWSSYGWKMAFFIPYLAMLMIDMIPCIYPGIKWKKED